MIDIVCDDLWVIGSPSITFGATEHLSCDWDGDGIPDLVAIRKNNTGTGTTEIHIYSGASDFKTPILHTGTGLHETGDNFSFAMVKWDADKIFDLVAIKKNGTDTGKTEVHIFSGATDFKVPVLQTAVALGETGDNFDFKMAYWNNDPHPDLIAIQKNGTGTGKTEVHIFSGLSKTSSGKFQFFKTPLLHVGTALHKTDSNWEFEIVDADMDTVPDLLAIITKGSSSGKVEFHIYSGSSDFQSKIHAIKTNVPQYDINPSAISQGHFLSSYGVSEWERKHNQQQPSHVKEANLTTWGIVVRTVLIPHDGAHDLDRHEQIRRKFEETFPTMTFEVDVRSLQNARVERLKRANASIKKHKEKKEAKRKFMEDKMIDNHERIRGRKGINSDHPIDDRISRTA